jgi:hypothetical protein
LLFMAVDHCQQEPFSFGGLGRARQCIEEVQSQASVTRRGPHRYLQNLFHLIGYRFAKSGVSLSFPCPS